MVNLLQYRLLNGWPLFFLIAAVTFAAMVTAYLLIGVDTPEPAVNIIRLSVQLASPWVFLAFVARPMTQLFPGNLSKWLLRNRRYFGLSFAAGFGWQAVFIGVLLALHNAYYWKEMHNDIDLLLWANPFPQLTEVFLGDMATPLQWDISRIIRTTSNLDCGDPVVAFSDRDGNPIDSSLFVDLR